MTHVNTFTMVYNESSFQNVMKILPITCLEKIKVSKKVAKFRVQTKGTFC